MLEGKGHISREAAVKKGDTVTEGEILISGTVSMEPPMYSDQPVRYYQTHARGRVEVWDSGRFFHREDATIVEWRFRCVMNDGAVQTFDGLSLVEWTQEGTIRRLQEFGCNLDTYDPYRNGDPPMFREERALWF